MNDAFDSLSIGGAFIAGLIAGVAIVLRVIKAVRGVLDDDAEPE